MNRYECFIGCVWLGTVTAESELIANRMARREWGILGDVFVRRSVAHGGFFNVGSVSSSRRMY